MSPEGAPVYASPDLEATDERDIADATRILRTVITLLLREMLDAESQRLEG